MTDPDADLNESELRKRLKVFRAMMWRARAGDRADLGRLLAVEALGGAQGERTVETWEPSGDEHLVRAKSALSFMVANSWWNDRDLVCTRVTVERPHPNLLASVFVGNQRQLEKVTLDVLAHDMPLVFVPKRVNVELRLENTGHYSVDFGIVSLWGVV